MVKGFVQTLESSIGAVLILSMVILLYSYQPAVPEMQLLQKGYDCLENLDNTGYLRYYAFNNLTELENNIDNCLPATTEFKIRICDTEDCSTNLPDNKTIILASYLISGYESPQPSLINLWVWSEI